MLGLVLVASESQLSPWAVLSLVFTELVVEA